MLPAGLHPTYIAISVVAYLAFLLVSSVPDLLGPRLVMDTPLQGTGWDPWFQLTSLLVPVAVTPLAITVLDAQGKQRGLATPVVPVGMLVIFAAGLWIPAQFGGGPSMGLPAYLLAVAAGLASILLVRRWAGSISKRSRRAPVAWSSGPGWLLVGGALAYAMPAVGVLAWPPVALGLVCIIVGAAWGCASDRLHPSWRVRRSWIGGLLAGLTLLFLPLGAGRWCLAAPLIYLPGVPALLAAGILVILSKEPSGHRADWLRWGGLVSAVVSLLVISGIGLAGWASPGCI